MNMQDYFLAKRVEHLERSLKKARVCGILAIVLIAAGMLTGQTERPAAPNLQLSAFRGENDDRAFIYDSNTGELHHAILSTRDDVVVYRRLPLPTKTEALPVMSRSQWLKQQGGGRR